MLRQLLETSEAGRKAASSLSKAVSVGVRFTDVPGDFRFRAVDGKPRFEPGKADEPDFELTLFPGAVHDVCGKSSADVGDLTVLFLQHIFANEPDQKILVKVHSGLVKLTMRGWLRVVVAGCPKLIGWLATPDAARPLRAGRLRSQRARPGAWQLRLDALVETRTGLASHGMARVRDRSARVRPDGVFVVLRRRKDG